MRRDVVMNRQGAALFPGTLERRRHESAPRRRAVVSPPPIPPPPPVSLTDVRGRPNRTPLNRRAYTAAVRSSFRTRLATAFLKEELMWREEQLRAEGVQLRLLTDRQLRYERALDTFLEEDYGSAKQALERYQQVVDTMSQLKAEHTRLEGSAWRAWCAAEQLAERWCRLRSLQRFLAEVVAASSGKAGADVDSVQEGALPPLEAPDMLLDRLLQHTTEEMQRDKLFGAPDAAPSPSLKSLPPPGSLVSALEDLERQGLRALLRVADLSQPLDAMRAQLADARQQLSAQEQRLRERAAQLRADAAAQRERAAALRQQALGQLRAGQLRRAAASEGALRLHVCVADAYTACVAPVHTTGELTSLDMMRQLENTYAELVLGLEQLPRALVRRAEVRLVREEQLRRRAAQSATSGLARLQRVEARLRAALRAPPAPPSPTKRKPRRPAQRRPTPHRARTASPRRRVPAAPHKDQKPPRRVIDDSFFFTE